MNRCAAQVDMECTGYAVHEHHLKLRSQGGIDQGTIPVCIPCHNWIHAHPNAAVEKGLLYRSWEEVPVSAAALEKSDCDGSDGSSPPQGGSTDRDCPRCKGSGKVKEKPEKLEPARKRVTLGIRLPKDADENGIEVLESLLTVARDELRDSMGWQADVPAYFVLVAVLHDWISGRK